MTLRLRLVSWNLHGPPLAWRQRQRFAAAATHILEHRCDPLPDFILLQEAWFPSKAALLIETLQPHYDSVGVPRALFPGRKGGLLSFIRRDSGWQLRRSSFHQFEAAAEVWRFWEGDGAAAKGFQHLELERDGQPLALVNTHLQAEYGELRYTHIRRHQLDQLHRHLSAVPDSVPIISAGDFNTRHNEPLYSELERRWNDLTLHLRFSCRGGTTVTADDASEWIDYVLTRRSPRWSAQAESADRILSRAPDLPYSDHHGLDVTLRLERTRHGTPL